MIQHDKNKNEMLIIFPISLIRLSIINFVSCLWLKNSIYDNLKRIKISSKYFWIKSTIIIWNMS
jgi:hypothetical protein